MLTDISEVKRKFFSAWNCIYWNSHDQTDLLQLQLQESYSLQAATGVLQPASSYRSPTACKHLQESYSLQVLLNCLSLI